MVHLQRSSKGYIKIFYGTTKATVVAKINVWGRKGAYLYNIFFKVPQVKLRHQTMRCMVQNGQHIKL